MRQDRAPQSSYPLAIVSAQQQHERDAAMLYHHAVVWIDHHEAHLQSFTRDESDSMLLKAHGKVRQLHHRRGSITGDKAGEDSEYFSRVGKALTDAQELLIVGPAQAKHEFAKYLEHHLPQLAKKVVGVETVDHPTDGQLLNHARRYFRAADRMQVEPGTR